MLKHVGHHRTSSATIKSPCSLPPEERSPFKSPSFASAHEDSFTCNRTRCGAESTPSGSPPCSRMLYSKDNLSSGTPSRESSPSSSPSFSRLRVLDAASRSSSHLGTQAIGNHSSSKSVSCTRIQFSVNSSPSRTNSRIQLPPEDSPSKDSSCSRAKHPSNPSAASSPSQSPVPSLVHPSRDSPKDLDDEVKHQRDSSPSESKGHEDSSSLRTQSPVENSPSEVPSRETTTSTLRPQPSSTPPSAPKSPAAEKTPLRAGTHSCCISSVCFRWRRSPQEMDAPSPEPARKPVAPGTAETDSTSAATSSSEDPQCAETFALYDEAVERPMTLPRRAHRNSVGKASKARLLNKSYCNLHTPCKLSASREQTMSPVKVYMRNMKPDIKYTTMNLSSSTTCRELVVMLLAKFRLRHRDPNLFYVRMEVVVRSPGGDAPARRLLVLDDHACPAELQQCRPRGEARFSVGVRRGGLLRVHDSILMPGSQYKSLLVSYRTTAEELVQLLLNCYSSKENPKNYAVHEVNKNPYSDRLLDPDEFPLLAQSEWPRASRHNYAFVLRRNMSRNVFLRAKTTWRHSLAQSSTDTESDPEDHGAISVMNSFQNMLKRTAISDPLSVLTGPSGDLYSPSSSFMLSRKPSLTFSTKVSPEPNADADLRVIVSPSETNVLSCTSQPCEDLHVAPRHSPTKESASCDIVSISSTKGTYITIPDAKASTSQPHESLRSLDKQYTSDESSFYI
ncbi:hypothetical protein C7M84_009305 [Penaeus vannamei]|uniref:Ras-associating domain-containing protein n=1 Tax=Penaeus vannamei TaxID=6689 RepID=A0A3R7PHS5_PENVA|nr:hypothetical protein C7M84_009305 [Penaeus vannamei]